MKASLSVVIVDDEYWAREKLNSLLADYPQIKIVGMAATVQEARDIIAQHNPDAVFLDIQLRRGTGFDVLEGLQRRPRIVFVTAFDAFALRAFEVNALDYLLKPIDRSRLAEAVNRLLSGQDLFLSERQRNASASLEMSDQVMLSTDSGHLLMPVQKIAAITADGNYTQVITTCRNMVFKYRQPLKRWLSRLAFPPFLQLDRSKIVNTSSIASLTTKLEKYELHFTGTTETLVLGRVAREHLKKFLSDAFPVP